MKKLYTILLLTVCACNTKAQTPDKKFSFLFKGGINIANYRATEPNIFVGDDTQFKNFVGFNFSALANAKISQPLGLQFGLGFSQKGTIMQLEVDYSDRNGYFIGKGQEKFTHRITYLELPLNVIYSYKNLSLGAGPYLAYAIAAKSIITPSNVRTFNQQEDTPIATYKSDLPIGNDDASVVKPLDIGVNFLADYKIKYGLSLGVNYGLGITKASKLPFVKDGKNSVFSILVGYNF